MEAIRRLIRNFMGYNSYLYKMGAYFLDFAFVIRKEGLKTWITLKRIGSCKNKISPTPLPLQNLDHPILVRPQSADVKTIIDNIIREEYGQICLDKDPKWMIDAGAYIGDTSAYFLSRFSNLKVIALEPNLSSYNIAIQNLSPYEDRSFLLKKGLAEKDQICSFGGSDTGVSIHGNDFKIECISIPTLLDRYSIPKIDILKMDIEGAEEAIFSSAPELWLDRINMIIMEIHGLDVEALIFRVLSQNGFSLKQHRSVWYCFRR